MKLFVVPTPIGNLEDITLRALRVLRDEVGLILAEDTRTSSVLLRHYEIITPMQSFHKFNEHTAVDRYVERIQGGESVALISDAGTPCISDPGYLLVRRCLDMGVEVECLPGAVAFVPALVDSGLPSDCFSFVGFLPVKKGRQTRLQEISQMEGTVIMYESPHRIVKTLEQLVEVCGGNRKASLSRELTKKFEETLRGSLAELLEVAHNRVLKGEMVLVLEGVDRKRTKDKDKNKEKDGRNRAKSPATRATEE